MQQALGSLSATAELLALFVFSDPMRLFKNIIVHFRLIEVLQEMGRSDWQLASMVCKTLWNFSFKITSSDACFGGSSTVAELTDILSELLGELR